jgi:hypothetical protein
MGVLHIIIIIIIIIFAQTICFMPFLHTETFFLFLLRD